MHALTRLGRIALVALALASAALSGAVEHRAGAAPGAAMLAPLATRAPLTAAARAGDAWVAVGDYGVVLVSTDGRRWQQAAGVPFDGLLTATAFVSGEEGWAVGHGGTVLHSGDGGRSWQRRAAIEGAPVLLSVWFRDASAGIVTGAYGSAYATVDGGRSWRRLGVASGRDADRHLNHIFAGPDGALYIAAESGAAFRSRDGGSTWSALATGASGSLWGGAALSDGTLLLIGMSGRMLASRDRGDSWTEIPTGTDQALASVVETAGGGIVAVGNGGTVVSAGPGLAKLEARVRADRQNLAALALAADGRPVFLGQLGVSPDESANP